LCDNRGKAEYSAQIELSHISWFGAQEILLINIINDENRCAA